MNKLPEVEAILTKVDLARAVNQLIGSFIWTSPILNSYLGQVEPPVEYRREGFLAFADGDNWKPNGTGIKGLYRYNGGVQEWVRIG